MVTMTTPSRKRWFQLSLRAFLLILTVACVWLGTAVRRATQQQKAVEWITKKAGRAWYDFEIDNPKGLPVDFNAEPPGPDWLRNRIGVDYFANLRWVEVAGADDISLLATLHDLQELHVDHSSVTDITAVKKLTNLRRLFVRHSPISDISPVAGLTNLNHLSLNDTHVRDVAPLYELKNLRSLNLHRTLVTEQEVAALKLAIPDCGIVWSPRK